MLFGAAPLYLTEVTGGVLVRSPFLSKPYSGYRFCVLYATVSAVTTSSIAIGRALLMLARGSQSGFASRP